MGSGRDGGRVHGRSSYLSDCIASSNAAQTYMLIWQKVNRSGYRLGSPSRYLKQPFSLVVVFVFVG